MGGFGKLDVASLAAAVLIIVIWAVTKSPSIAIVCGALVNTIGKALVAVKVYHHPNTEYLPTWVWSVVGSIFAVLSVGTLNSILILPGLQNGITVGIIAAIIYFRCKKMSLTA